MTKTTYCRDGGEGGLRAPCSSPPQDSRFADTGTDADGRTEGRTRTDGRTDGNFCGRRRRHGQSPADGATAAAAVAAKIEKNEVWLKL